MAKLLIPAKPRRGPRLPLTLATFLVPLVGLFIILNIAPVRSPLGESEASLALAVLHLAEPEEIREIIATPLTASSIAITALGRTTLGSSEFQLRILGLLAGVASMGVLLRLGERLYSTRVGILAVILLFASPSGRDLLGAQLSVAPFYLLTSCLALRAIRVLAISRMAGVYAGIAIGASFSLMGYPALWLLLFTAIWLRRLRGLTLANSLRLLSIATVTAVAISMLSIGILVLHGNPLPDALETGFGVTAVHPGAASFFAGLLVFVPLLPVVALGMVQRPANWQWQGSPRFVGIWIFCSLLEFILTGQWSTLFVAICMAVSVPCIWAIENASRRQAALTLAGSLSILLLVLTVAPGEIARRSHEGWAARETGRFARRLVPAEIPIRTTTDVRNRIAYYGRRKTLLPANPDATRTPYILIHRSKLTDPDHDVPLPRELLLDGTTTRIVAEIGPYVLGKQPDSEVGADNLELPEQPLLDRRATFWQSP